MRRVLWVTGDTAWNDREAINAAMTKWLLPGGIVMTGGAAGADSLALELAPRHKCFALTVPYYGPGGRAGGPMRNAVLADVAAELHGLRFEVAVAGFGYDRGTLGSLQLAEDRGLEIL